MFWLENHQIIDINGLSELKVTKVSFFKALRDYCVYILVNSLEGLNITYEDFLDETLANLNFYNDNFNTIINHKIFSKYLLS